ncbi:MAG: AI-2E family transporter [Bacteroidota bacterium]
MATTITPSSTTTTTSPTSRPWTFGRVVWATLVFSFVIFCFYLVYRFYNVFFVLFIAVVLGTVIRPIASWLAQRGISRMASVILVYLALLLFIAGFLWLLFPVISKQGGSMLSDLPGYYHTMRDSLLHSPNPFFERLGVMLPSGLPRFLSVARPGNQAALNGAELAFQYVTIAARVIFSTIIILALTLYWTLDGPRIIRSLLLLIPQDRRERTAELVSAMEASVGYFIAGQGLLCLSIGSLALVAYLLIGLPNAFVLALAAGLLEAIPMVGPVLGAVPASLVALSIGVDKFIWVVVASIIIQQTENIFLVPRIMRRTVGVNPFVTLLSIFAFSSLFGMAGALMAIPLAAIIQILLNHYVFQPVTIELDVSEGRDYSSRLRYEAQDFIQDLRKQARNRKKGSDEKIIQIEHVMDEIETITENLDTLLSQNNNSEAG